MSKIGNHLVEMLESPDYKWGWESAKRGEPMPDWELTPVAANIYDLMAQQLGRDDYHAQEQRP